MFEATEGRWLLVVGETSPLLAFEVKEGRWWLVEGETNPLLAFEAMEGWWLCHRCCPCLQTRGCPPPACI
jgi:hypothetical protein